MISRRAFLASSLMTIGVLAMPRSALGGALDGSDVNDTIISLASTLKGIEANKVGAGLEDVDFSSLSICEPISFYEVVDGSLRELDSRYPILDQSADIRMFAYDVGAESMVVSTALAKPINDALNAEDEIAVVFDSRGCYLLRRDGSFVGIGTSSCVVPTRDSIIDCSAIDTDSVRFSGIHEIRSIDALASTLSRSARSLLQVGYVAQPPGSDICWAACVASIANYLNGGSRTARSVAQAYYGSSYDRSLPNTQFPAVLSANGVYLYNYYSAWPSDAEVSGNINAGYPLVGILSVNGNAQSTHAVVVCGHSFFAEIHVMDPEFGFTTAAKLGTSYVYLRGYSGATLKTIAVVRRR